MLWFYWIKLTDFLPYIIKKINWMKPTKSVRGTNFVQLALVSSGVFSRSGKQIKVPILKEVTSEKCNSVELNTFSTYLSSLLRVIAIVFSNHAQK